MNKIYEGDLASATAFENLVHWKTEKALGTLGTERILPWINPKSPDKAKDYVVIICDPRSNSAEFRQTVKTLEKCLSKDILDRLLVINADSPLDNRKCVRTHLFSICVQVQIRIEYWLFYASFSIAVCAAGVQKNRG